MAEVTLEERVQRLEQQSSGFATREDFRLLSGQISQLGDEMRVGFSALRDELRDEIRATDAETRRVLETRIEAGDAETRRVLDARITAGDEETRRVLRDEIRAGDEETRGLLERRTSEILAVVAAGDEATQRQARLLHEDLVERISRLKG